MIIKKGVNVNGVQPETIVGMLLTREVLKKAGIDMVVTSITDGKHRANSLHYAGLAFDIRTWEMPTREMQETIAQRLRVALGDEWDVVIEETHIHIEFDPEIRA